FPKTEEDIDSFSGILEIQGAEGKQQVFNIHGDGASIPAKLVASRRQAIFRPVRASKNSGISWTFGPSEKKCHPVAAILICPFSSSAFVKFQFVNLRLGNCNFRKILLVGWP